MLSIADNGTIAINEKKITTIATYRISPLDTSSPFSGVAQYSAMIPSKTLLEILIIFI
jgi:hypothetical protein